MSRSPRIKGLYTRDPFVRGNVVHAAVEVPAGTLVKRTYDPRTGAFRVKQDHGRPQRATHLAYPANYGFIVGTRWPKEEEGDGDPVDVFILSEAIPTGTVIKVK